MPIVRVIEGDLIKLFNNNEFDGIAHGCNCFHAMGSGIAPQVREACIEAYKADIQTNFGSPEKLGEFSYAKVDRGFVFNLYTQYRPGGQTDLDQLYDNIERSFKSLDTFLRLYCDENYLDGFSLGIPKIGCGIAGGDWNIVEDIIIDNARFIDITLVNYNPNFVDMFSL